MVTASGNEGDLEWAFLLHRLPREPSAPRIALWRATRRLGAILLGDGLIALPASPRTIEHLDWLAAGIEEHGGAASTWVARPTTRRSSAALVARAREAVDDEYRSVMREAAAAAMADDGDRRRALRRLRAQLRRIEARDYFAAEGRAEARAAVEALAVVAAATGAPR